MKYVAGCAIDPSPVTTSEISLTGSSTSDYSLKYVRNSAGGYDVNRCIICVSTSIPLGLGFHINVIENSLTFTD